MEKEKPKLAKRKYTVKLDVLVPATVSFNINFENEEDKSKEALEEALKLALKSLLNKSFSSAPQLQWSKVKKLEGKVYLQNNHLLLFRKKL